MNVYVESNFVLELALLQEQFASCEKLLGLCRSGDIALVIAAYSLAEPYETLVRRRKQRQRIKHDLDEELQQIARTATYAEQLRRFKELTALLISSADEDVKRLEDVLAKIVEVGDVIPLEAPILTASIEYQQTHDFSPQDAIVYAAIISDLRRRLPNIQSCFLNRNSKDFDDQNVVDELQVHRCKLLPRFDSGLSFVLSNLA